MVTEDRAPSNDHLVGIHDSVVDHSATSGVVEKWLQDIRSRIPAGAVLSATVRSKPRHGFFASFRLLNEGEVISSEARADTVEEAVEKAGIGLCQHLPFSEVEEGEADIYLAG